MPDLAEIAAETTCVPLLKSMQSPQFTGAIMVSVEILERLFNAISNEPITFNGLCRATKIHPRTVRVYLKMIEWIQKQKKVEIERKDFRLMIKKT